MFKKIFSSILLLSATFYYAVAQSPRLVADASIDFQVSARNSSDTMGISSLAGSYKVVSIKGSKSRSDVVTPNFRQSTIYDAKSDTVIVLREIGSAKYLSFINRSVLEKKNRKYEGIQFVPAPETKVILGYNCKKLIARLADSTVFDVYYAPLLHPSNIEYDPQFRNVPGLVLEYEGDSADGKIKVRYTAEKISLLPVPSIRFEAPKSGYRIL